MTVNRADNLPSPVATAELRQSLERVLTNYYSEPVKILDLQRQAWEYRSSFALESLKLDLGPRGELALMFKDLSWHALTHEARQAKRRAMYDPLREISVYEDVLRSRPGYGATCYGSVIEPQQDRYWLFIEQVDGQELYQIGDFAVWLHVVRWLAQMHAALRPAIEPNMELHERLIRHGAEQQELWFRRACAAVARRGDRERTHELGELSELLPKMAEALCTRPTRLIHGEFYPSNILIGPSASPWRVCPVDWEMAGFGIELLDLAALVVGRWTKEQEDALAWTYYETTRDAGEGCRQEDWREEEFFETLDYCRLYIALQWLGWSDDWTPPADHAHDWLQEAQYAAARLADRRA